MKVLLINGNLDGGGAAQIARELYCGLKDAGIDTYYMVGWGESSEEEIEVLCHTIPMKIIHTIRRELRGGVCYTNPYAKYKIIKFIREKQIDIVHFHNIANSYFGFEDIEEVGKYCKVVWTLHEMWALTGHCGHNLECRQWRTGCKKCPDIHRAVPINRDCAGKVWVRKKRAFSNKSIVFVTPSKWLENRCRESYLKHEYITTINNGIHFSQYIKEDKVALRKKYGVAEERKVLLFVAANIQNEYKGFSFLEEALIGMENTDEYSLVIMGSGIVSQKLKQKMDVVEVGIIREEYHKQEIYRMADLLVITSIAENFPTVVLEAMASGIPVLGFDTGGISEMIDESCGWIVEKGNSEAMRQGIVGAFGDKDLLKSKGDLCIEKYRNNYKMSNMIDNYIKLYTQIVNGMRD